MVLGWVTVWTTLDPEMATMSMMNNSITFVQEEFNKSKHAKYFHLHLNMLPEKCSSFDSTRITLLFFAISGLDVLDCLDTIINPNRREEIIGWIYRLQVLPNEQHSNLDACGFLGSTSLNFESEISSDDNLCSYRVSNIALTYSALCTLLILGDDLSRVNKKAVLHGVKALQEKSGSFKCTLADGDCDMRFVFCACAICFILNDWSGMDRACTIAFIMASLGFDGAFGQGPYLESHGGSTYCALASLTLMDRMDVMTTKQIDRLKRWLINRQRTSFQGRPNKPVDTCYTFWIGSSLAMLDSVDWVDEHRMVQAVLDTQHRTGGFSKWHRNDTVADIMHTYLGIAGLSLFKSLSFDLSPVYPALNITQSAYVHLKLLHQTWSS
uniref:Geranylgeranyl transferase type-1 subunit beta n=1 Tax=Cacopsylla melanoneura TaxID=428564 RepID=A0A8D8PUR5_9HEMI